MVIVLCGAAVLALGGCTSSPGSSQVSSSETTAPAVHNDELPAISAAVRGYQASQGVAASRYRVAGIQVSTVDPSWARFQVGPVPSDVASFQGGYGFVHRSGGQWRVVTGLGTADVGCPLTGATTPAAVTYVAVPPAVLAAFGSVCPPSAT